MMLWLNISTKVINSLFLSICESYLHLVFFYDILWNQLKKNSEIAKIYFFHVIKSIYFSGNQNSHHDLLISFSIWTNTSKLTSINRSPKSIRCLHGLRAISILWVILGHRFTLTGIIPITNFVEIKDVKIWFIIFHANL